MGLKRGVLSRAGPGAVAPLATLKRRPLGEIKRQPIGNEGSEKKSSSSGKEIETGVAVTA